MGAISHQLGFKAESTWGTPVTVDRFVEFTSESLGARKTIAGGDGIRPGVKFGRGSTRRVVHKWADGSTEHEIATTGYGLFFHHLLGAAAAPVTVESGVFLHTFSPGTLVGKGITVQKGVEKVDGTTQAFTYEGGKVKSIDFSNDQDGIAHMAVDWDFQQELTGTALATASYVAPTVFHYAQGALKFAGATVANVRSLGSLSIVNNLDTERYSLGQAGLKNEPLNRPKDTISGNAEIEFADLTTFHNRFTADTSFILVMEWIGDVLIGATQFPYLRITLNDTRLDGDTPTVSGADAFPVRVNVPFSAWDPAAGNAVEIAYQTTDATP